MLSFIGTTDTELFNHWVENCLCPELKENDVVIMDNARIHKSEKTRKLIESKGAMLKFQPPYSPQVNKIEHYWAFIKRMIGLNRKLSERFEDCLDKVFRMSYEDKNNCKIKVSYL